jgi:phenylacetate-coenzyme A ligase PaaK-like adenylate-forming protein
VVEKSEMAADAEAHPPYGTYTTIDDKVWAERGWMMFASSGSTGAPRVFRYSHVDREMGAWANARALHSMDFRHGDTVFMITGYGPHVWAWGVQYALEKMRLPVIPGGGMDARAVGSFAGRADDLINLRGIKMFPIQLEQAVRAIEGTGDEFEIMLTTDDAGLDIMTVRLEHESHETPDEIARLVAGEVRTRCEVQAAVEVLARGTLPKTEFKAKRVRDERKK